MKTKNRSYSFSLPIEIIDRLNDEAGKSRRTRSMQLIILLEKAWGLKDE